MVQTLHLSRKACFSTIEEWVQKLLVPHACWGPPRVCSARWRALTSLHPWRPRKPPSDGLPAGSTFRGTQVTLPQPVPFLRSPEAKEGSSAPSGLDESRSDPEAELPDHTCVQYSLLRSPRAWQKSHPPVSTSSDSLNSPTGQGQWDRGAPFPTLGKARFI